MAFNPALLVKLEPSSLFTQPATIPNVQPAEAAPQFWMYNAGTDAIVTVEAAGYFHYFAHWLNTLEYNNGQFLAVGDLIWAHCSNGDIWLSVTAIDPQITTAASVVPPDSISTADIQNLAVTAAKIANLTITNAQISATAAIAYSKLAALTSAHILVGSAGNVATDTAVTGDVTISNTGVTAIGAAKVTKAMLAATVRPAAMIVLGGNETSVGGGGATEAYNIPGIVGATDLAFAQIVNNGTNNVTLLQAVCTNDTLTITYSADPGADTVFNYQIVRATA